MPPSVWPTCPYFIRDRIISGAAQRVVKQNQWILIWHELNKWILNSDGRLRGDGEPTAHHVSRVEMTTFFSRVLQPSLGYVKWHFHFTVHNPLIHKKVPNSSILPTNQAHI